MRSILFILSRVVGDRVLRVTYYGFSVFFLLVYLFQLIVSLGLSETEVIDEIVGGYVLSFGGRTAYILTATVCAVVAARLLSCAQNAILFTQGKSLRQIWTYNMCAAFVISAITSSFYIVMQMAVLGLFVQAANLDDAGLDYLEYSLRSFGVLFFWGLIGYWVSYILRNQAASIVILLVFGFVIEPLATAALNESDSFSAWVGYLPGSLNWALAWPAQEGMPEGTTTSTNELQSVLGLLAYAALSSLFAYAVSFRSGRKLAST